MLSLVALRISFHGFFGAGSRNLSFLQNVLVLRFLIDTDCCSCEYATRFKNSLFNEGNENCSSLFSKLTNTMV